MNFMCVPNVFKIDWEMAAKNPRWPPRNLVFFFTFQHQTVVNPRASSRSPCLYFFLIIVKLFNPRSFKFMISCVTIWKRIFFKLNKTFFWFIFYFFYFPLRLIWKLKRNYGKTKGGKKIKPTRFLNNHIRKVIS